MPALNDKFVSVLGRLVKVVKNGIQSMGKINPKDTINTFLIVLLGLILFFLSTMSFICGSTICSVIPLLLILKYILYRNCIYK